MSITIHNQNDNNNNDNIIIRDNSFNNNNRTTGTQACAACKYQRRKCASDCLLAPYFPHHLHHQFLNAHKLFGVSNITKVIRPLSQPQKDLAMRAIKYESDIRALDPVGGSYRIMCNLQEQIELACAELELVMQQLAACRAASATHTASLVCGLDPLAQPQSVGVESEDVVIHTDNMINNEAVDHESNKAYRVVDQALSPIHGRTHQQFREEDHQFSDENKDKHDIRIEEYLIEGDNEVDDKSNDVILSFDQDMDASWAMQDGPVYYLHDKEAIVVNECEDLKPGIVDIGGQISGLTSWNDEHSDEAISKDNKAIEETASSNDEKPVMGDFATVEDAEIHDFRTAAT